MRKDVLLVLSIFEGQGWRPIEGFKTVIEARLDKHTLSTGVIALTANPKFNTEISWEAERQTIRSYKLNRVPIKLECFAVDEKHPRRSLGYVVLPLTSAVEGIQVDPKWHKLLGGPNTPHQSPPSILLQLSLVTMTLDQQNKMNGKHFHSIPNGQIVFEDRKSSYLMGKTNKLEMDIAQQNGSHMNERINDQKRELNHSLLEGCNNQSSFVKTSNGIYVEDGTAMDLDEMDSDNLEEEEELEDEEDMDGYESEEKYSDNEQNNQSLMIVDAFSMAEAEFPVNKDEGKQLSGNKSVLLQNASNINSINKDKTNEKVIPDNGQSSKNIGMKPEEKILESEKRERCLKQISDNVCLLKNRAAARKHLLNMQATSNRQNSHNSKDVHERSSLLEKRLLDTSQAISESFEQKLKSRKIEIGGESCSSSSKYQPASCLSSSKNISERNYEESVMKPKEVNTDLHKTILANDPECTSIALLLSQSLEDSSNKKTHDLSKIKGKSKEKLTAKLNEEKGCFYITPQGSRNEDLEEFVFAVTIIYAKNLDQVISEELHPSLSEGFQFCYSLLGFSVYTDPFFDLNNPDFLAERATAAIKSTPKILSEYFGQHYFLPIHLMNKDNIVASCSINTEKLMEIESRSSIKIESIYDLLRPTEGFQNSEDSNNRAKVAVSLELAKSFASSIDSVYFEGQKLNSSPHTSHSNLLGKHLNAHDSDYEVSDSESVISDLEMPNIKQLIKRKSKYSREKRCPRVRSPYSENTEEEVLQNMMMNKELDRHKKVLLHEAAYEVERWKEEQKMLFLKEWSSKEETLQKQLAIEWSTKMKLMEGELGHRLSECDHLQEKLNSALGELSLREDKVKLKEKKINQIEKDLIGEKEKLQALAKAMENEAEKASVNHTQMLANQVEAERNKKEQLQQEVTRLYGELKKTEDMWKVQNEEIIHLRRTLIQSDDIIGVAREKEELALKVESLLERKQYYKNQWLSAISDLHKLHSAHKRNIDEITSDIRGSSPQEFYVSRKPVDPNEPSPSSNLGFKLRKLKDERKILLESGIYPHDHYIIKRIDKKIRDLVVKSQE